MISVCMTTFNGEKFLQEQIDSILPQLAQNDELLISDDGSTDATPKILATYAQSDPRIHILQGPKKGVVQNVQFVLKQAKGTHLFLADQDDIWLPHRVDKMMHAFKEHPEVQLILADLKIIDYKGNVIHDSYFSFRNVKKGRWRNILRSGFIGAGMAITAELKEEAIPFPDKIPMHDMWLGTLAGNRVFLLDETLTLYRRHSFNTSELETTTSLGQKAIWRLDLICALFKKMRK